MNRVYGILGFFEGKKLLTAFGDLPDENKTLYDFFNFITSYAKDLDQFKSIELQKFAGEIIAN